MREAATSGAINLWLSSHLDLELASRLRSPNAVDVIVHGTALAKYRPSERAVPLSHLHWLDDAELARYATEKRNFEKTSRDRFVKTFAAACDATSGLVDPVFAGVLEQLFLYCRQGCLDAMAFARSPLSGDLKDKRINVVVGGQYRLVALVGLIWWLAVLRRFGSGTASFYWTSKTTQAVLVPGSRALLDTLSANGSALPSLDGEIPASIAMGQDSTILMWVGAVRFPEGWSEALGQRVPEAKRVLRVAENGLCGSYVQPCIELSVGTTAASEDLHRLMTCAEDALRGVSPRAGAGRIVSDALAKALEEFFRIGVAPFVVARIAATVEVIDSRLSRAKLKAVASATAPFLETVALHQWARKRGLLPVLLPHSWTSSHEFPAASYQSALTFVKSDQIMPSGLDDPGSLAKEELVPFSRVAALHRSSRGEATALGSSRSNAINTFAALPTKQKVRVVGGIAADAVSARLREWAFHRQMARTGPRLGYILNYEHFEFNAGVEFGRFFRFVGALAEQIAVLCPGADAKLIVRRKPGWTNPRLLYRQAVRARAGQGRFLISPNSLSLEAFGDLCDLVLYSQGTSAIPELMSFGVPVVELTSPAPILLVEPYVVPHADVVPRMALAEVMERVVDVTWVRELGRSQGAWVRKQMVES